jgi:CheY-like chemotaxis protein
MRVLLVDDCRDSVTALQLLLELAGYQVSGCTSGHEAHAIAQTWTPDVLVVDVAMPGMSGDVLVSRLREMLPTLFAIAVSGCPAPLASISPFDHYLVKPADPAELQALLQSYQPKRLSLERNPAHQFGGLGGAHGAKR